MPTAVHHRAFAGLAALATLLTIFLGGCTHAQSPAPPPPPPPPPPRVAMGPTYGVGAPHEDGAPPPAADGSENKAGLPAFPWPPPSASARVPLPQLYMVGNHLPLTFGDIDTVLSTALDSTGYGEKGYYFIPNGFVIASRMEQIYEDGRSMPVPARFSSSPPVPPMFSLDYFKGLFIPRNGYFRVVVFTVTNQSFSESPNAPTETEATNWPHGGANVLPISLRETTLPDGYAVTALIYEFKNTSAGDSRQFVLLSPENPVPNEALLNGTDHLHQSGLWAALGLH